MAGARGRSVVAVDLDGTLAQGGGRGEVGEPVGRIVELARECFDAGHFVVVYTARPEEDRALVASWLLAQGVKYDLLELGKLRYDVLVDDRAVRPQEFEGDVWNRV